MGQLWFWSSHSLMCGQTDQREGGCAAARLLHLIPGLHYTTGPVKRHTDTGTSPSLQRRRGILHCLMRHWGNIITSTKCSKVEPESRLTCPDLIVWECLQRSNILITVEFKNVSWCSLTRFSLVVTSVYCEFSYREHYSDDCQEYQTNAVSHSQMSIRLSLWENISRGCAAATQAIVSWSYLFLLLSTVTGTQSTPWRCLMVPFGKDSEQCGWLLSFCWIPGHKIKHIFIRYRSILTWFLSSEMVWRKCSQCEQHLMYDLSH